VLVLAGTHERPDAAGQTGAHLAFAAGVVASSLAAVAIAYVPGRIAFDTQGHPDPTTTSTAALVGGGFKVAVTYLLLPELYRLGGGTPDIDAVRAATWRWVRWPAVAGALFAALMLTGALLERGQFGRGEPLIIGGFAGLIVSNTLFDVLSIVGSSKGYRE
jgi:hypothetical protein